VALLEARDLSVTLATAAGPAPVLRGLNLTLERGSRLGLVGESGSGKSMTALALIGLLPDGAHASGSLRWDGQEMLGLADRDWRRLRGNRIAMVFQEPMRSLNPLHRIGAQIAEGLRRHQGLDAARALLRARDLIDRVGLPDPDRRLRQYPHELSGGQRQRVMIAMALACQPDLLIADEPTSALDVTVQAQILDLIDDLAAETGMAVLLISHNLAVIRQRCQAVAVMYGGCIVEQGPTAALFAGGFRHPYAIGLQAALPRLGQSPRRGGARVATIPGTVPDLTAWPAGCAFAPRCALAEAACRVAPPPLSPLAGAHHAACYRLNATGPRDRQNAP